MKHFIKKRLFMKQPRGCDLQTINQLIDAKEKLRILGEEWLSSYKKPFSDEQFEALVCANYQICELIRYLEAIQCKNRFEN